MRGFRGGHTSGPKVRLLGLAILVAVTAPAGPVVAQGESGAAPEAQTSLALPLSRVSREAETIEAELAELVEELRTREIVASTRSALAEREAEIAAHHRRFDEELSGVYSRDDLNVLYEATRELDFQVAEQQRAITRWIGWLDGWLDELDRQTGIWQETRMAVREAAVPGSVRSEIVTILGTLSRARNLVAQVRGEALELQRRLIDQRTGVQSARERIDEARLRMYANLFTAQQEPLWRVQIDAPGQQRDVDALSRSFAGMSADLVGYTSRHRDRVILHLLAIVGLLWIVHRARSALEIEAARGPVEEPGQGMSSEALAHPTASALLVGLGLGPVFYLPLDPPLSMRLAGSLLFLPAALVVMRGMLPRPLRSPANLLIAAAVVDVARTSHSEIELMNRLLLMVQLALGLVAIWRVHEPERLRLLRPFFARRETPGLAYAWLRLAILGMAVGLIATPLGYANLADLSVVLLRGSYFALIIVAVTRVLGAIVAGLVEAGDFDRSLMIRNNHGTCVRVMRNLLGIAGILTWLYVLLWSLQLRDPLRTALADVLSLSFGYGPVQLSAGGLLAFAFTLWLSWLLARFLSFVLDQEVFARASLPRGMPLALSTFTRYAIFVVGFLIAMAMLGFSIDRVTLVLSALGVGIGFGLQTIANNLVSGLVLLFERPIRVGDTVQLDDLLGVVTSVGMRASRIRSLDGADVIVPNGDFVSVRVINWTYADRKRRVILPVGVAYGSDPHYVMEILQQVAAGHPEVLEDPPPEILFRGFGESSLDFEIRAWTESDRGWLVIQSDLGLATSDALRDAGIAIPFPQRDLHVRSVPATT